MMITTESPARAAQVHAHFRLAAGLAFGAVAVLWLIALLGWGLELERFGVRPREWSGLPGILLAPLLHSGLAHLVANSVPLAVLGTTMLHLYPVAALRLLPAIYLLPGALVWLFGNAGVHVGSSGVVYGLLAYIFVAGVIRRDRRALAAAMLVAFLYGAMIWGVLPIRHGVSWETHLAAAVIGAVYALLLRNADPAPRVVYSWEGDPDADADNAEPERSRDGA
jgi:membrane associated rhomboid family serine protease